MQLKQFILWCLLSLSLFAGEINVAVAANVSYAIKPLVKAFHQSHPHTKVHVILGSSGKLTAQIRHGAPYQLFLSADMRYPQSLYHDKIASSAPRVYAKGKLAYLSRQPRDFSQGLKLLSSATIVKIAIANPKTAPYGIAAKEALSKAGLYRDLKKKLVYGESISQTLSFTLQATDIGLIAKSALFSPKLSHFKEGRHWATVSSSLYAPIKQGVVLIEDAIENAEARAFYAFLFSPVALEIFEAFGYSLP